MHSNRHTRSKITRWCIKVVGQKKTKILGESLLKSHGASIQILITDSSVALAIELLSFGLWEPSTTKSLAPRLIRISHSQNVELYSTHGGGCYCKKSIRVRTNLWCAYVNFFLFFGSVRTNLWMMWISFWFFGSIMNHHDVNELLNSMLILTTHKSSKGCNVEREWINVSWAQRKIESFYCYFFLWWW